MSDTSVYERVLGDAIDGLDPGLRRYFGALSQGSVGAVCLPLTRFAGVTVHERAASPAGTGAPPAQAVDVRITMPMLGEVFRYAGTFTYAVVPIADPDAATP